jgi:superfamily II DNA helicase RecQ
VSEQLDEEGITHVRYHGGLSDQERTIAQEQFISKSVPIAVATNAFGMGIDRSDITIGLSLRDSLAALKPTIRRLGVRAAMGSPPL